MSWPADQPVLRTTRLVLRPFSATDAFMVQQLAGDREVADTTLNLPHPYGDGVADAWITSHQMGWDTQTVATWAIVTPSDELRGAVGLNLNVRHRRAEIGYWIGRPWWGQGLATEAVRALLEFAFTTLELNRVQATHLVRNPASGRVMQKAGMSREGLHREKFLKNDALEDVVEYAVLRKEWQAQVS